MIVTHGVKSTSPFSLAYEILLFISINSNAVSWSPIVHIIEFPLKNDVLINQNLKGRKHNSLLPGVLLEVSGVKTWPSTALGITDTMSGFIEARKTVFSLLEKK